MAKYKSLVEIRGSIDDLVFYNLNGIPVVRKKSGFNKTDYKNNPKYAKVRENSGEFGHCSKSGKMIRMAIHEFVKDCGDQYMYQKFAKVMTQIKDLDTLSPRGKRNIPEGLKKEGALGLLYHFKFGEISNVVGLVNRTEGLFGQELKILNPKNYDEIEFVQLNPDFNNYSVSMTEIIKGEIGAGRFDFDQLELNQTVLYFLVLKKGGKVTNAGFI